MEEWTRTRMLFGAEAIERLRTARIALLGLGGVGSYVLEALVRSGAENLALFDGDVVSRSNLNRQLIAEQDTIGMPKTEAAKRRILSINPGAQVACYPVYYTAENEQCYPLTAYDYVIDAIDMVSAKLLLAERAYAAGVPIISSMGTGNKLNPAGFEVADISKTSVCPLARVMRRELKKRGISHLKVVYSREQPRAPLFEPEDTGGRRQTPGSTAFVPAAAGLLLASEVIFDLTGVR